MLMLGELFDFGYYLSTMPVLYHFKNNNSLDIVNNITNNLSKVNIDNIVNFVYDNVLVEGNDKILLVVITSIVCIMLIYLVNVLMMELEYTKEMTIKLNKIEEKTKLLAMSKHFAKFNNNAGNNASINDNLNKLKLINNGNNKKLDKAINVYNVANGFYYQSILEVLANENNIIKKWQGNDLYILLRVVMKHNLLMNTTKYELRGNNISEANDIDFKFNTRDMYTVIRIPSYEYEIYKRDVINNEKIKEKLKDTAASNAASNAAGNAASNAASNITSCDSIVDGVNVKKIDVPIANLIVRYLNKLNNICGEKYKNCDFMVIAIATKDKNTKDDEFLNALVNINYEQNNLININTNRFIKKSIVINKNNDNHNVNVENQINYLLMLPIHDIYDVFMDVYNNTLFESAKYIIDDDNFESWNKVSVNELKF